MELVLVRHFGVRKVLEEPLILVFGNITLVSIPDGLQRVDQLSIQFDRVGDEQGVLFEDLLNLGFSGELARFWL